MDEWSSLLISFEVHQKYTLVMPLRAEIDVDLSSAFVERANKGKL